MFNGRIHKAVMAVVKEKISEAQYAYDEKCAAIDKQYQLDLEKARQLAESSKAIAENEAVESVIGKLLWKGGLP